MKHRSARERRKPRRPWGAVFAIIAAIAIAGGVVLYNRSVDPSASSLPVHLPTTPESYLGLYSNQFPGTYAPVTSFEQTTGTKPDVAMYYSGWYVPFPTRFANTAAANGVVPLVQMDPDGISLRAIAGRQYDAYLSQYAEAVAHYRHPVIISFGHEMNGTWYSWGYRNAPAKQFVAAWRHIVTLFRALGAGNVTWMWTVNILNNTQAGRIPSPAAWWPGNSYVNWVGIDGYYLKPSWAFAPLFGPTIGVVRTLTTDPILIAETGAVPKAGQAAKVADLFDGIHSYGLLGFVWFDATNSIGQDFALGGSAALAAFRKGARTFTEPG